MLYYNREFHIDKVFLQYVIEDEFLNFPNENNALYNLQTKNEIELVNIIEN